MQKYLAVDRVDVGVTGRAEEDQVARGGPAVGVRGGIGRSVVGTEIGLHLHDAAGQEAAGCGGPAVCPAGAGPPRGEGFEKRRASFASAAVARAACSADPCPRDRQAL